MRTALVFGVGHINSPFYENLEHCTNSATKVFDVLTDPSIAGCDQEKSRLFVTKNQAGISAESMFKEVRAIIRSLKKDDQLIFFFTGHGELYKDKLFLISSDAENPQSGFRFSYLLDELSNFDVERAIIIIDTCHSSAMFKSLGSLQSRTWTPTELAEGFGFIASCGAHQYANPEPNLEYTLFSHYFIKALKEGISEQTAQISLSQLRDYINRETKRLKFEQTAHAWIKGPTDIFIANNIQFDKSSKNKKHPLVQDELKFNSSLSIIWEKQLNETIVSGLFTEDENKIVLFSSDGKIIQLDPQNEKFVDSRQTDLFPSTSRITKSGDVALLTSQNNLWKYDFSTHKASLFHQDLSLNQRLIGRNLNQYIQKAYLLGIDNENSVAICGYSIWEKGQIATEYGPENVDRLDQNKVVFFDIKEEKQIQTISFSDRASKYNANIGEIVVSEKMNALAFTSYSKLGFNYYRLIREGKKYSLINSNLRSSSGLLTFNKKYSNNMDLSFAGNKIAVAFQKTIEIYDISQNTQKPTITINTGAIIDSISFTPNLDVIGCGQNNGNVFGFWNIVNGTLLRVVDNTHGFHISPKLHYLLTWSKDGHIKLWGSFGE